MNRLTTLLSAIIVAATATAQTAENFNLGWQFAQNGDTAKIPEQWQGVNLPHDWSIYTQPDRNAPSFNDGGYYGTGVGWYKKSFSTPKLTEGERVVMYFEGVYHHSTVYVNGKYAGRHGYGYTPFSVDVTPFLNAQGDNTLMVRVDNSQQRNSRWYSGSGIYRNVWLRRLAPVSITPEDVKITATTDGKVTVEAIVTNNSSQEKTVEVKAAAADASNSQSVKIAPHSTATVVINLNISNPKLWSVETPNLYKAEVSIDGAKNVERKFGFREIKYNAQDGFSLNGKNLIMNGACVHHDNGLIGAAAFDGAEYRKVKLMKDAGFNLLRTSHNPPSEAFLDACDELGMMVVDEAFDGWRTEKTEHDYHELFDSCAVSDIKSFVLRDRHHPSVVAWSIGNEIIERKDIRCVYTARMLKKAILSVDDSRPVTEGLCAWDRDWEIYDPHAEVLDIAGYNYMIFKHKSDHERDPQRIIWQTESYPRDAWNNHNIVANNSYVIGDMVWTGLDYLGESGIGGWRYKAWPQGESWQNPQWPWHGAYCGDVDITGFRKPISYYRDIIWNGESASAPLHLAAREPNGYVDSIKTTMWSTWPTWDSWNWEGWENKPIDVEVYAPKGNVKLYLNDKLIGEKAVERNMATFTLDYQPGVLRAECDGKSSNKLVTAGKPAKVILTTDHASYKNDGCDIAYINITIADKDGNPCAMAFDEVTVSVKNCELLALGTADLRDSGNIQDATHTTWHGRALAIVRLPKNAKSATVTVKGKGIAASTVKVK